MVGRFKRNRKLGVAQKSGRYDLPLNASAGTHFLILLVALMTFLAVMALSATFFLGGVTQRWSSGLENKLTIEIPALNARGKIREAGDIDKLASSVSDALEDNPNIKTHSIMDQEQIQGLVSPWLGDDVVLEDIPLPGLISVELQIRDDDKLAELDTTLKDIAEDIRIDTHETWLGDILRLAGTLKLSAFIVTLIIGLTTITAIAGAIRSRMAEHKADIELLHLMGASDLYITKQLQRHAVVLTLKGSLAGVIASVIILGLLFLISGQSDSGLLPGLSLNGFQIVFLLLLPVMASLIASQAARFTVLRVLGQMP